MKAVGGPLRAEDYLCPPARYLWTWVDDGDALQWTGGNTITLRQELVQLLEPMAVDGFPPGGPLVLLLAVSGSTWPQGRQLLARLGGSTPALAELAMQLENRLQRLDAVHAWAVTEIRGVDARRRWIRRVFESIPVALPAPAARTWIENLKAGVSRPPAPSPEAREVLERIFEEIDLLYRALGDIDAERWRTLERTGLEALPGAATEVAPNVDTARALISGLESDRELGGLA